MTTHYLDRPRTRIEKVGAAFVRDDRFERLLAMPGPEREGYLVHAPSLRLSLAHYLTARPSPLDRTRGCRADG